MTPKEAADLILEQHSYGRKHGIDIADVIHERFPPGSRSTRFVRRKLRQIINRSFTRMQNSFLVNGVDARFRHPFADGFIIGLKERDPELSPYLDQKVTSLGRS